MKTSAIILALLYIFSSFSPVFITGEMKSEEKNQSSCSQKKKSSCGANKKSCGMNANASAEKQTSNEAENKDCETGCYSVLACPLCLYLPSETQTISNSHINLPENKKSNCDKDLSTFSGECWNPPEMASK